MKRRSAARFRAAQYTSLLVRCVVLNELVRAPQIVCGKGARFPGREPPAESKPADPSEATPASLEHRHLILDPENVNSPDRRLAFC